MKIKDEFISGDVRDLTVIGLNKKKTKLNIEIDKLGKELNKIQNKFSELINERTKTEEAISKIYISKVENITDPKKIDWNYILDCSRSIQNDMVRYSYCKKRLEDLGLYGSGYYPNTEQKALQISLPHIDSEKAKEKIKQIKKSIGIVFPYLKPSKENNIRFGILSNDCSESGILEFLIDKNDMNKCTLLKTTYGCERKIKDFTSLEDSLTYIADRFWYGDPHND